MLGLALLLVVAGAYIGLTLPYLRVLGAGLIFFGLGCLFCGLTDGFTDPTPRGYAFRKLGFGAYLIGIPILAYATYYFI